LNLSFQFNGTTFIPSIELGALGAGLVAAMQGFWIVVPTGTVATMGPVQKRTWSSYFKSVYSSIINPVDGETYT
jgi:hypothetical protein